MTKAKQFPKLLVTAVAAIALSLVALTGCSGGNSSEEDKTITVAAVPTPHAEILTEVVAPALEEQGYTLEVKEFTDYVQPNTVTEAEEVDANYFQHKPYLDNFNEEQGTHLVDVVGVHYEPFGLYSTKYTDLSELPDGATIAVPNDATNEARALLLLQDEGLITLSEDAGITATPNDIVDNPKNLKFKELEAAVVPTVIDDVDVAGINANYALEGNLLDKILAKETSDSLAAQTYANLLVVKDGNQDSAKIKALAEVLNSDAVRDYINDNYQGAVLAVF
ncbi:MetQ/NlpA family ABC transporter substrate-binding protein [Anaerotardibacter muris]|uniref:MetQ/NlpA family ABC transporter substrate-binding protein n=1 Tax=Anaerotardibacter muris TaxID=2941505 RepID=UPI00203F3A19|nr:MetQ/NlpA family ABC transporter substrate-binding protein [Anaerotardibacter muris]